MAQVSNRPVATALKSAPFQLRAGSATLMVLRLLDPSRADFAALLAEKVGQAPGFFRDAPLVLDLEALARWPAPPEVDFAEIRRATAEAGMCCVGVQNGTPQLHEAARKAGLVAFPTVRANNRVNAAREPEPAAATPVAAPEPARPPAPALKVIRPKTRIVSEPVRSGQQVYATDADLIVHGTVNAGAEVLADGHVHVYGALRGKAIAGASGDREARLFCQKFDPELVSIAGLFLIADQIDPTHVGQRVMVRVADGALVIDRLP